MASALAACTRLAAELMTCCALVLIAAITLATLPAAELAADRLAWLAATLALLAAEETAWSALWLA